MEGSGKVLHLQRYVFLTKYIYIYLVQVYIMYMWGVVSGEPRVDIQKQVELQTGNGNTPSVIFGTFLAASIRLKHETPNR